MNLDNTKTNIQYHASNTLVLLTLAGIMAIPGGMNEVYVKSTIKSIKEYKIHIEDITTKCGQDFIKISGDTIGTLVNLHSSYFEENKDYTLNIRNYGFNIIKTYRLENIKEIIKIR
jgi:hypothetical protein